MILGTIFGEPIAGCAVGSHDVPQGSLLCRGLRFSHAPAPTSALSSLLPAGEVSDETCHSSAMRKMSPCLSSDTTQGGEAGSVGAGLLLAPLLWGLLSPAPMGTSFLGCFSWGGNYA